MSLDAQLLAIFRQEADERLEAMVATLLAAEAGEGDAEAVRELFRHAHSLKGTAGMVGLDAIARIAAAMEDVLADARQSGSLDRALAGPLLVATDAVRATLGGEAVDLDAVVAALPAAEVVDVGPAERGELQPPALPAAPAAAAPAPAPAAPMLRVAAERVDGLLDAAGEAVLHRRRLEHLVRGTDAASDERVLDELERGEALLDGLQHAVLDLRTLPLASIVGRLPRAVRDVAASEGREVELELDGVDTQLDRTILDGLSDPLVHLLRNAVAHGIEPPDEREAAGKPRAGRLRLRAEAAGAYVAITVSDDGRGVAPELLARADGPLELAQLLGQPGLSTAGAVGPVAGRGVGLDAVLRDVRRLGGGLLVTSEPGRGSVFTLRLPITLAVLHVLLVERAGQTFGIAVGAIREALQDEPALRHGGRQAVRFRDEAVPLADLGTLLGAGGAEATDDGPILVLEVLGRRVAVRCDRLVGEEEVVVKPLGPLLGRLPSYLGATILDDGRLALIVDVRHVVQVAATAAAAPPRRPDDAPSRATRLLVVDDQVTVRELQRTILGAAGYEVVTARDGREALELLDRAAVDLVLTDVEMPGMDGFALIEALRADPDHTSLPVIVLSSRGDEVDRRRGAEAGADAYVVKSEFDQRALLETVRRLVIR